MESINQPTNRSNAAITNQGYEDSNPVTGNSNSNNDRFHIDIHNGADQSLHQQQQHLGEGDEEEDKLVFNGINKGQHRLWGKVIGGRFPSSCVVGPDFICLFVAYLLILFPATSIIFIVAPTLHWMLSVVGFANLCVVMYYLSYTAFSDPGIIPKQPPNPSNEKPSLSQSEQLRQRRVICPHCNILRPAHAFHCTYCDACILELDHHCPVSFHLVLFQLIHILLLI